MEVGVSDQVRFWLDAWIAQQPLKDLFPNLYALECQKGILVGGCFSMVDQSICWKWRWKKEPTDLVERREFDDCSLLLMQFQLRSSPDKWAWPNDNSGRFSVASMRKLIFDAKVVSAPFILDWNSWVPKKVNIFAWRARLDRLPSRVSLTNRNIQIDSIDCRLCGVEQETTSHLLVSCQVATWVWHFIGSWCGIPPIYAFSVKDLLSVHKYAPLDRKKRTALQGIIMTACWCIWKSRNEAIF
jgi:hypothetical protein